MTTKKLQPEIRFSGFTDDWEQRKLGEFIEDYIERTTIQNQYPVLTSSQKFGVVLQEEYFADRQVTTENNIGYFVLPKGMFTYRSRSDNGVFRFNRNDIVDKGIISYFYPVFQIINGDSNFFVYLLNTTIDDQITFEAEGTGQKVLSLKKFKNINIHIPSLEEQTQIGNFFKQLDDTIALHQRTLEKYQKLKISYLEKMFPKENELHPELRFPNFTDAWEQRKLGDIAKFLNGRAYKQNELLKVGKYPVLRVGNFYTNSHWYYSNLELSDKFYAQHGDLLYTWATVFSPHIWNGNTVIYHYHIWKIELSDELNKLFAYQLLKADEQSLTSNTNGSTMVHVTKTEIENKIVTIPSLEEQTQIGNFFKQLDDTITLHQREVEKYKKIKQSYLEKMFI